MPCLEGDTKTFTDWFMDKKLRYEISHRSNGGDNSIIGAFLVKKDLKKDSTQKKSIEPYYFLTSVQAYCSRYLPYYFDHPLPPNSQESYAKWRILNPTNSIFHHTNLVQYAVALFFLRIIFYIGFIGVDHLSYFELQVTSILIFAVKDYIYKYVLMPCRIELRMFFGVVSFLVIIATQFFFHRRVFPNGYFHDEPPKNDTLSTILNKDFGAVKGANLFRYTLSGGSFFNRWMTLYFPWY
jgi:hypothetical protein